MLGLNNFGWESQVSMGVLSFRLTVNPVYLQLFLTEYTNGLNNLA